MMFYSIKHLIKFQTQYYVPILRHLNNLVNFMEKICILLIDSQPVFPFDEHSIFLNNFLNSFVLCVFLLQLPILASSVVSLYFLELTDIFQPVHSGYSCNDRSLSLPYILPRQEVCPLPLLFSLAFAAPTATVSKPPPLLSPHWTSQ